MVDWTLLVFCALVFCAALTGAFFRPGTWYERLERPSWTPPDWAFPVVWTTLYAMIAAAGWLIWTEAGEGQRFVPLGFWALQLALNALWSPVFFGMRRLGPAPCRGGPHVGLDPGLHPDLLAGEPARGRADGALSRLGEHGLRAQSLDLAPQSGCASAARMNWMILEIFLFFLPVLLWGWWEQRSYKRYLAEKGRTRAPGARRGGCRARLAARRGPVKQHRGREPAIPLNSFGPPQRRLTRIMTSSAGRVVSRATGRTRPGASASKS